ncbi:MAG: hypothetical protein PF439_10640 [Helicobacteraceae bacterium]|jgi:hypothetical protein|nr:hypothetical protein [Helicobacteraceae bacterium]
MKKILIALSVALLIPFASTASAAQTLKIVPKQKAGIKTLESRIKSTQEREARKVERAKQRKLQDKQYNKEKAERKQKIDADRKAEKDRKNAQKKGAKAQQATQK